MGHADAQADEPGGAATGGDGRTARPSEAVPSFRPARLEWQVRLDFLLRLGVSVAVVAVLFVAMDYAGTSVLAVMLAVALAIGTWMLVNGVSARTSSELPRLSAMIEDDPAEAEAALARQLRRRPLLRWVRLLLYHRLALLRHRQQRYGETAAICQQLLSHRLGPAEGTRRHLLLLLAESQLERRDLAGAYPALSALHQATLPVMEAMQRLTLQTRYELAAGYPRHALWQWRAKVRLAELMPADHDGAVHAMLATAADRCAQGEPSRWLWDRAALLCDDAQRQRFERGEFSLAVVSPPHDVTMQPA